MLSVDAEQLQAVTEYLIYDPQNTAAISHLTHASDPVDHDGRAHTRGRRSAVIENYPLSVVSIPRFIEHSLREFLEASPDTSLERAEEGFKASVPWAMRFLLAHIDAAHAHEHSCKLLVSADSRAELKSIVLDTRPHRSKWADAGRVGQAELYDALEKVLIELKAYTPHSLPFIHRVSKKDVPDYYEVIRTPMDLTTMFKKLRASSYSSKADFQADLDLIHENCYRYNTTDDSPYRMHARELRERWMVLMRTVPDIVVRAREEIDDAIILGHQRDEEVVDERADMPVYESTRMSLPRRHARLMGRLYSHPEFEAFYNSVPDSRAFPTPPRCTREWTSEYLARCIALIRDIRRICSSPGGTAASSLADDAESDSAIWIESPLDTPLNAKRLAQRMLTLLFASKGVRCVHRSVLNVLTDVLFEQMRSTLATLSRLIDEHALHMGLEVRGRMGLYFSQEMLAKLIDERGSRVSLLRTFLFQRERYAENLLALRNSATRTAQRLQQRRPSPDSAKHGSHQSALPGNARSALTAEGGEDGPNVAMMISEEACSLPIPSNPPGDAHHSGMEEDDGMSSVSIDSDELVL